MWGWFRPVASRARGIKGERKRAAIKIKDLKIAEQAAQPIGTQRSFRCSCRRSYAMVEEKGIQVPESMG